MLISTRVQTLLLIVFLAMVGGAITVLYRHDPKPSGPKPAARSDLDSGSQPPIGSLEFTAGAENVFLRVNTANCRSGGSPTIELSADGGWRFGVIRVPQVDDGTGISATSPSISSIAALDVLARRHFMLWGTDSKCEMHSYETNDAGVTWEQGDVPPNRWYVDPKTGLVMSPTGPAPVECDAISTLRGFDADHAVATCQDRSVHVMTDGTTWEKAPDLMKGAGPVFFTDPKHGYVIVDTADCHSQAYVTDDAGDTWTKAGCVFTDLSMPALGGSADALITGGSSVVWVSADDGETWKRPVDPTSDPEVLRHQDKPKPEKSGDAKSHDQTDKGGN